MRYEQAGVTADIADADIIWYKVLDSTHVSISGELNSGSGTISVKRRSPVAGTTPGLKDSSDDNNEKTYIASFEDVVFVSTGDEIGFGISGASSLDVDLRMIGNIFKEPVFN